MGRNGLIQMEKHLFKVNNNDTRTISFFKKNLLLGVFIAFLEACLYELSPNFAFDIKLSESINLYSS